MPWYEVEHTIKKREGHIKIHVFFLRIFITNEIHFQEGEKNEKKKETEILFSLSLWDVLTLVSCRVTNFEPTLSDKSLGLPELLP